MKLRIYFSAAWHDHSSACPWAMCNDAGFIVESGNSLLSALPKADDYIAIISSEHITCVSVAMPAQSRRRWETALPFIAEEYTLTDPEENHVVPGPIQKNGQRSLFVVDKQWLRSVIVACQSANLTVRLMLPEMLLPEIAPDNWVIVWDGSKGFMRTGISSGMALDLGDEQQPPLALTLSLNASLPLPPKNIEIRFDTDDKRVPLPRWINLPVKLTLGKRWDWRVEPIPNNAVNLLWGSLKPKTRLFEWLPKLRPALFILLAIIFIETLGTNIEWGLLNHQKNFLTQDMERNFRKAFGESSVVVNPPLQMQRNVAALRHSAGLSDDADFLSLLDQSSSVLVKLPAGSINAMHYESGRIDIDIKLPGEKEIVSLQQQLQSKGLSIRLGDFHKTGNAVETRLTILAGGAS
jgi:general secretion pathway protein L